MGKVGPPPAALAPERSSPPASGPTASDTANCSPRSLDGILAADGPGAGRDTSCQSSKLPSGRPGCRLARLAYSPSGGKGGLLNSAWVGKAQPHLIIEPPVP